MPKRKQTSRGLSDYFMKLMLTLTSFIMILSILLTGLLYFDFRTVSDKATEEQELSAVKRSAHSVIEMTSIADLIAQQLRANPTVSAMLSGEGATGSLSFFLPEDDTSQTGFINSIYFLNPVQKILYIYDGSLVKMSSAVAEELGASLKLPAPGESVGPMIGSAPTQNTDQTAESVTYLYGTPSGTIIINVSTAWLNEKIGAYQDGGSRVFTVTSDGTRLKGSEPEETDESFITTITASSKESNVLLLRERGSKYYVSYVKTPAITYVRVRPYAATQSWNYHFSSIVILSFCIILLIGILLATLLARNLSKPVHHMSDTIERLENRNNVSQRALKQEFLSNLLVASHLSTREIGVKFADCKMNISDHAPIFMILLKLDRWHDLSMKYNHADCALLKYGLMNIAEELISDRFVCDLVDDAEDSMVILCNYPSPAPTKQDISSVLTKLNEALATYLQFSVTSCVGYMISDITRVSTLYDDTKRTAEYRLYFGHGSIIYTSDIPELPSEEYVYPVGKEKQLIDAMMLGKPEKCNELLQEITEGVRSYSPATTHSTFSRLSMSVNMTFSDDAVHEEYAAESERLFHFVQKAETLDEITRCYQEFFRHLADSKSDQKSKKYDDLIARIHARIEANYADPNLSVNSIAEGEHRSPVYLGRLYKSHTGRSISEYINEVRIREAKRLLVSTNLTVNDIAEKIGFSGSSYFYTVFKKHQGIAPNDYRQKQKRFGADSE